MRIHRLEIEAFGPFAEPQRIDFDHLGAQGLFLLNGATGAGKTSILDAVCFALYGAVPGARQEGKRLRSDHAAPAAEPRVVCEFTARGRRFEVTRSPSWDRPSARGRNGYTTQQAKTLLRERTGGAWQEKSSRNDEVGAELSDVLGMDREQFTRVVMLPQGDFAAFLRSKASDRLDLLQKLFGTERFEAVEKQLARMAAEAAKAVEDNTADLKLLLGRAAAEREALGLEQDVPEGTGAAASPADSLADTSPEAWLGALGTKAAAERDRRELQADAAEAHAARLTEKLHEDQDKARRHGRLAAAMQRRVLLELAAPRALEDKERLGRHRRAAVLKGQLDAAENADRACLAAGARCDEIHGLLQEAGLAEEIPEVALESTKTTIALVEARVSDEQRMEAIAGRIEAKHAERTTSDAAAAQAQEALKALAIQESAVLADIARLEPVAAKAGDADRAAAAAMEVLDVVDRYARATAERDAAEGRHAQARTVSQDLRQGWLDLREARLANAAGELAAALVDGEACAVCGSAEHPHPASAAQSALSLAQDEDESRKRFEASEKVLARLASELSSTEQELAALAARGGAVDAAEAASLAQSAKAEASATRDAAQQLESLKGRLEQLHRRADAHREEHGSSVAAAEQAASLAGLLQEQHTAIQTELAGLKQGFPSLQARLEALTEQRSLLQSAVAAGQEVEQAQRASADALAVLDKALPEAGFGSADDARRELLTPSDVLALETALSDFENETARLEELFAAEDLVLAGKEASIGELPQAEAELAGAAREAAEAATTARELALSARLAGKAVQTLGRIRDEYRQLTLTGQEPRERARLLAGLADTLRGAGENTYRMSLNSYVLAARLEQVALAASERLVTMSDGRYTLHHTDARAARNQKSGLGLEVVDEWTGQRRDTSTLSGGESFMASLSLALGLADVVQQEAGGVDIETLFVDEGFGSLDEQALEQVMDALEGLRDGGRVVGLVSHVADMKQRITSQLHVVKGRHGSTVKIVEAMPV
ncbi:AAA family ATPase [Paenarthrobacter sp. NPDC090522]|uniref:AAA family ATPase n=1 Tax=Paenarthrobacter sp. NPDC090522 TaxID=3364383 RepID=UPI00380B83AD